MDSILSCTAAIRIACVTLTFVQLQYQTNHCAMMLHCLLVELYDKFTNVVQC